jgi:hypothetical protein
MKSLIRIGAAVLSLILLTVAAGFVLVRQPSLRRGTNRLSHRANASRLQHDVVWLTTNHRPRSADHPENLDAVADFIATEFAQHGATVTRQRFHARGKSYQNVIASFGGGGAPSLIVGAHYDVFSDQTALPGADDNGSGVAALLELSRLLSTEKLQRRIDLVAYTNEEPPFFGSEQMGSAIHAGSIASAPLPPMVSLEMIGYFTDRQPRTNSLLDHFVPSHGHFVVVAGRWRDRALSRHLREAFNTSSQSVSAYSLVLPQSSGIDASDQLSYWRRGFEAVMITDTAYVRNPNYHTARDTAESLDYERMASVVDGVTNFVLELTAEDHKS